MILTHKLKVLTFVAMLAGAWGVRPAQAFPSHTATAAGRPSAHGAQSPRRGGSAKTQRGKAQDGKRPKARGNLTANEQGVAHINAGRYKEAVGAFTEAIRLQPDDAGLYSNLGFAYVKLNQLKEAVEALQQAIKLDPTLADAHYNLGGAYRDLGQREKMLGAYQQAVKHSKGLKESWAFYALYELGEVCGELGRWADAVEAFKQAVIVKPNDAFAHFFLGEAHLKLGNHQAARGQQQILTKLDPDLANRLGNLLPK